MWVEELTLENVKGFEKLNLKFSNKKEPVKWITLLAVNGGGKSTVLQALSLLLAGPENVNKLLPVPYGWTRREGVAGKMTIRIHQGENDPGTYGEKKESKSFGYTYFVTGSEPTNVRNKTYTEPTFIENAERRLTWLKQNALTSRGKGWFAAGYGAFRRNTKSNRVIVPTLLSQDRFNNFLSQFREDEPLSAFEQWMIYLDYRIAKGENGGKSEAERQMKIGVTAINNILPDGVSFDSVSQDGRILFNVNGTKVPTINLSDGYRSILALMGDLIWRLLDYFPQSIDPLKEEGVVIIDELDIHLHPVWQRTIPMLLRKEFPNIQFIVATHSPMIVAGAGTDALTYRFVFKGDKIESEEIKGLAFLTVDDVLRSSAFSLVSPFSPETEKQIEKYLNLKKKSTLTPDEKKELQTAIPFAENAYRAFPEDNPLEHKIQKFLEKNLK